MYVNMLTDQTHVHHVRCGNGKSACKHHSQDSNIHNCSVWSFPFHFSKPFIFRKSTCCEQHARFNEITSLEGETCSDDTSSPYEALQGSGLLNRFLPTVSILCYFLPIAYIHTPYIFQNVIFPTCFRLLKFTLKYLIFAPTYFGPPGPSSGSLSWA